MKKRDGEMLCTNLKPFDLKEGDLIEAHDNILGGKRKMKVTKIYKYIFKAKLQGKRIERCFIKTDYCRGKIKRI